MSALDRVPVPPELVERFRSDVARVRPLGADERLALAVSGGPDSMAMLALAAAAFPGQVIAATVDHRLRSAGADEARMVAVWCASNDIPHATLIVRDQIGTSSVQARARARRYALLQDWAIDAGAACLATAHHADDQAETFLMRAARGSGVAGLGGIRALQRIGGIDVIRPLLGWRVAELRALAVELDLPFVDDPSNVDAHYDRTRFRTLLQSAPWLDPLQIARSAAYSAEADATIRAIEAWLWQTRATAALMTGPLASPPFALSLSKGTTLHEAPFPVAGRASTGSARTEEGAALASEIRLEILDLPRELKRRLSRRAIHTVRAACAVVLPAFNDSTNIEPLLDTLEAGKSATQAGILVTPHREIWRFTEQPPRRSL